MRLAALAPLFAIACSSTELELEVDHYQVPCVAETLKLCLLTKDGESTDWNLFREDIEGYTHVWGQSDRIRVTERKLFTTSTSGAGFAYSLVEVLSSEDIAPGVSFLYPFRPEDEEDDEIRSVAREDGGGTLLDGKRFVCETDTACNDLDDGLGSRATVIMSLTYADPIDDDLILTSVSLSQ